MSGDGAVAVEFVKDGLARLAPDGFIQVDLDELIGETPRDAASRAINVFARVGAALSTSGADAAALLVLPLRPTRRLVTRAPNLQRLLVRSWSYIEPPAFYLTGRNFWSDWGNDEEYRIPVDSSESLGEKLYCYYRIFKSPQARAQGWEYSRGLYIFSR